jgi:predicted nucleic acid-binding protein
VRAILADTGPLYAAAIASDQYHARAQEELTRINRIALPVFVLYSTVVEAYSLVLRRVAPPTAHAWVEDLLERVNLLNPTAEDYHEAVRRVQRYKDQELSLFDALLAVVSNQLDLAVWTFDSDFDTMRVPIWRGEA